MMRIGLLFWICFTILWSISAQTGTEIIITPESALYDEPVDIVVTGLPSTSEVTIRAETTTSVFILWESEATFMTDSDGRIDLSTQAPISGTYTGVDPMGLFWSMQPPDLLQFPFFHDFDTPLSITFEVLLDGQVVATTRIERLGTSPEIERIDIAEQVEDYSIRGTLFLPPGDVPHPTVVVLGGSEGGLPDGLAAPLASRGYAAFALAYFNYDDLPTHLSEIPLEYFDAAIAWLGQHPAVDSAHMGIIGLSKGAEAALLIGSRNADLSAIIAVSPTHLIWQGLAEENGRYQFTSSWSVAGEGLAFTRFVRIPVNERTTESGAIRFAGYYDRAMAQSRNELIPVGDITAPVLMLSGEDDQIWSAVVMGEIARAAIEEFGGQATHIIYPDAGHVPTRAYLPTAYTDEVGLPFQQAVAYGGTPEGNAYYASDAQSQIQAFLGMHLNN